MTRINMKRINAFRSIVGTRDSVAWGKDRNCEQSNAKTVVTATWGNINAVIFAAVLVVCSFAVGCSKGQPKTVSVNNQTSLPQPQSSAAPMPAPTVQAENKPAPKKVVHRKPATVNYTDKTYGVTFEYPRRYAIETGDAAADLLLSSPAPMNFVQPGGVAIAAVELPETGYANTDFSSAFFDVSVHKTLTADQCTEFAVPQPKSTATSVDTQTPVASSVQTVASAASTESGSAPAPVSAEATKATNTDSQPASAAPAVGPSETSAPASSTGTPSGQSVQAASEPQGSKLLLGDMELNATEAVSGEGTRQSDSKYFHVLQNGSCYEFALNVTTMASQDGLIKHVNRDKVFDQLEKILATVKIDPVAAPQATAETPVAPTAPASPAQ
jgi:hypothetical protein